MADVQEIPLSAIPEDTQEPDTVIIEDTKPQVVETVEEEIIATPKPKAKAKMGRPPGAKDTKQRAKPKPKAKIQRQISRAPHSNMKKATIQKVLTKLPYKNSARCN